MIYSLKQLGKRTINMAGFARFQGDVLNSNGLIAERNQMNVLIDKMSLQSV